MPAQLPAGVPFAGRSDHLTALDALLAGRTAPGGAVAVTGTGGVGKSALAVHWCRRSTARFPDGQLYLNMRGYSPDERPVPPEDALRSFLDALHVPADDIPADPQARIGLYRSLLANRRVLVLLDNARDAAQVRPLLPAAGGCLAVVTSRDPLTGLAVTDGAHLIDLDLLTYDEAVTLLAQRLGRQRIVDEPGAARAIVDECGGLPLALSVVAARAAGRDSSLDRLATELRAARGTLDAFAGRDGASDVRMVFSLSYRELTPDSALLFRLLHLQMGDDIALPALAAAAGRDVAGTRALMAELLDASLVREPGPGRYVTHDLLRAYARELAEAVDAAADRNAARDRLFGYYLHSAFAADEQKFPRRSRVPLAAPRDGITAERFADDVAATAWFDAEISTLLEAVETAESDSCAWQLAWCLTTYLNRTGRWHEWWQAQTVALAAAQRLADPRRQAHSHMDLGNAANRLRQFELARAQMLRALSLYERSGDRDAQARCHGSLALIEERAGRYADALAHAQTGLTLTRFGEDLRQTGSALNTLGWYHALVGDHEPAITLCREGLRYFQLAGDLHGEAYALDSLGYAEQHLGRHEAAIEYYGRALALSERVGERYLTAQVTSRIGDTHAAAGDDDAARRAWRAALALFHEIDARDAAAVRAKLTADTGG